MRKFLIVIGLILGLLVGTAGTALAHPVNVRAGVGGGVWNKAPVHVHGPLPAGAHARIDAVEKWTTALPVQQFPGRNRNDSTDRGLGEATVWIDASAYPRLSRPSVRVEVRRCVSTVATARTSFFCPKWENLAVKIGKPLVLDRGRRLNVPFAWELDPGMFLYQVLVTPGVSRFDASRREIQIGGRTLRHGINLGTTDWRNLRYAGF